LQPRAADRLADAAFGIVALGGVDMAIADLDGRKDGGNAVLAGAAIGAEADLGNGRSVGHREILAQPLVAPAVRPPTNRRCMERKRMAIGSVITTEAAITAPQSVLNSVENSARPM